MTAAFLTGLAAGVLVSIALACVALSVAFVRWCGEREDTLE